MVEIAHSTQLEKNAAAAYEAIQTSTAAPVSLNQKAIPLSNLINYDPGFAPVQVPAVFEREFDPEKAASNVYNTFFEMGFDSDPKKSTYLVRGEVTDEAALQKLEKELAKNSHVVGVYADVTISSQLVCAGSPPVGNHLTVEKLLCVPGMKSRGMDGAGVLVAVVDTGVNMAYLSAHGKTPGFNAALSWSPNPSVTPGSAPVGHGTMCAFDICIAAPKCTLIDIPLLSSTARGGTVMEGLLSDAVRAYSHLLTVMSRHSRPGENRSLVVNNSWGMFHPSWDYPTGHPGNYSSNPNHPFNRIVVALTKAGADILFAAGNCGPECPDGRCQGVTNQGIYGANSSPAVYSVAGTATNLDRVGYSNKGPGRLDTRKPDITGYTHFSGSGVYSADGGTSAACPVVAGVVAAVRTVRGFDPGNAVTSPIAIRNLLTSTAKDLGASGYDYFYGYGLVNPCAIIKKLFPYNRGGICDRFPIICRRIIDRPTICEKYPVICREIKRIDLPFPPKPVPIRLGDEIELSETDESAFLEEWLALTEDILSGEGKAGSGPIHVEEHPCKCHENKTE